MDKKALAVRTAQWRQIVDECNRSTLCKTEWCRKNGIRFRSLMYWQKKFRDQELLAREAGAGNLSNSKDIVPLNTAAFVDVTDRLLSGDPANPGSDRHPVCESGSSAIMIRTGCYQVYLNGEVSEKPLRTVMRVLRDV